ncbi:hypothetical protein ES702_02465 [subsurface metagenome]
MEENLKDMSKQFEGKAIDLVPAVCLRCRHCVIVQHSSMWFSYEMVEKQKLDMFLILSMRRTVATVPLDDLKEHEMLAFRMNALIGCS